MSQHVNCIKEVTLAFARMQYNEPIVEVAIDAYEQIGFPEVRELRFIAERLTGYKPYFLLLQLGPEVRLTNEGKKAIINLHDHQYKKASAIIVTSPQQEKDVAGLCDLASVPTRSFSGRQEALKWLSAFSIHA